MKLEVQGNVRDVAYPTPSVAEFCLDGSASEVPVAVITAVDATGKACMETIYGDCVSCPPGSQIGYTTLSMETSEEQELVVKDALGQDAYDANCTWEIISGGGTLSADSGYSVTYTAPATNEDCLQNPTIALKSGDDILDQITIAVNADDADNAYRYVSYKNNYKAGNDCSTADAGAYCAYDEYFKCDGTSSNSCNCAYCDSGRHGRTPAGVCNGGAQYSQDGWPNNCISDCIEPWYASEGFSGIPSVKDIRTEQMKSDGCCPEALL